ncbi:SgcJ/EcaC family oxidoreductase [Streptosporangium sp. G12]
MSADLSEDAAIRRVVADAVKFQSDVDRFISLHAAEAAVVNFGGRRVAGRDALAEAMRRALASSLADVTTTAEIEDIRFLREDVAIVASVKHVHDRRRESGDAPVSALPATSGRLTYVMVKEDGTWRIASAQTTPILA